MKILEQLRHMYRRRRYRTGAIITHFIARDIRRDVEVIDDSEVDDGFVTVRIRTWNVLYTSRKITPEPDYSDPERHGIEELWSWDGALWGGPVIDDKSKLRA